MSFLLPLRRAQVKILLTSILAASPATISVLAVPEPGQNTPKPPSEMAGYRTRQETIKPSEVLAWLKAGNARFQRGVVAHPSSTKRIPITAPSQRPIAVVFSCIDSRTTPELVFDTAVGDLFTARNAGTVVNDDVIGSIEVSVESGAKVVVVLGHTDCGGIKGACAGWEMGKLTQLLARIKPAVDSTLDPTLGPREAGNPRFVSAVSHTNARNSATAIVSGSQIVRKAMHTRGLLVIPALYNVQTGTVHFDEPLGLPGPTPGF